MADGHVDYTPEIPVERPKVMPNADTAEAAQQAFYRALEANDLEAMMAVWDDASDIVCIHPMGEALRGVPAVKAGWAEIFAAGIDMRFAIEELLVQELPGMRLYIVKEHITVASGKPVAPMTATNLYRRTPDGWRMVLHHASPSPSSAPRSRFVH